MHIVCHEEFYDGLLWRAQIANNMNHLRCSDYHPSFQSGVYIGRMCNSDGQWEQVDYSNCTMDLDAQPFIAIEVILSVDNQTDPKDSIDFVTNRVRMLINYQYTCSNFKIRMFVFNLK